MKKATTFKDLYCFPGFRANARLKAHAEHEHAWIVTLHRRQKKRFVPAAMRKADGTISRPDLYVISIVAVKQSILKSAFGALSAAGAMR
jgi:hypothetical protein